MNLAEIACRQENESDKRAVNVMIHLRNALNIHAKTSVMFMAACSLFILLGCSSLSLAAPTKIGVSLALTGESASYGIDIKNALLFANEKLGKGQYEFVIEDSKCSGKEAVAIATKFINIDKLKYVLGFTCNAELLPAAPIYQRAGVILISSSATSGDVDNLGDKNFRLFPSDKLAAERLFGYLRQQHKRIGIITEQNEYPVMMERTIKRLNLEAGNPLSIVSEQVKTEEGDYRNVILKLKASNLDAIYVNTNAEAGLIRVVNQMAQFRFRTSIYAAYFPASRSVRDALKEKANGIKFANLPSLDNMLTSSGKKLFAEYRSKYGEPNSGLAVIPIAYETFRALDLALQSGQAPEKFLKSAKFKGEMIDEYFFDQDGAGQGIKFQMQEIVDGHVVVIEE